MYKVNKFYSNARCEHEVADVLVAVLQGRSWERAEGAAAEVDLQAMLQKVRSTVIQETPLGTAGGKCFCCGLGLSDQA